VGPPLAVRGDLEGAQAGLSVPPAPPIVLASQSPQRRAILEQLRIPFEVVPPSYEERDAFDTGIVPVTVVQQHARGKARSVAEGAGERPVLGVDTEVVLDGRVYGKPADSTEAEQMLEELGGRTHDVVSGLCLLTPGWEELHAETTRVTFRPLTARDVAAYIASREWEDRAGGYAIQGVGAALVERIEGDYLNVVGLPAALLIRLLAARFGGIYGYG
jgi:septum formation protein